MGKAVIRAWPLFTKAALKKALSTRGPTFIHASIAMREQVLPMVAPGAANKDMIGG